MKRFIFFLLTAALALMLCGCMQGSGDTYIKLVDGNIKINGNGVNVVGNQIRISQAGAYVLSGKLSDGYVLIQADREDAVELILDGVDITCSSYAAIVAMQSKSLTVTLKQGSENFLCDGEGYTVEKSEADGCIFSNDDIVLRGEGSLTVTGNYKNAIASDDNITIISGKYKLISAMDALNANERLQIQGGELNIEAGDDAAHSDEALELRGGIVNIEKCYEGLESARVLISGGEASIVAMNDGVNGAVKADAADDDSKFKSDGSSIVISGGILNIISGGDGIDSNGTFNMTGGEVYVSGPTDDDNSALDYDVTANISGGIFIAAGSAGEALGFSASSEQSSVMITFALQGQPGDELSLRSAASIAEFAPQKEYNNVIFSAPGLIKGQTYALYKGKERIMEYEQTGSVMSITDTGENMTPPGLPKRGE